MPPSSSRKRHIPWVLIVLTLLVLATAVVMIDPIREAVNGAPAADARLERGPAYVALGPISSVLDLMTLFTVGQIIGFTLWVAGAYVGARIWRRREQRVPLMREVVYAAIAFVCLIVVYAAAAVLPRPMAQLVVIRDDVISVDFHSHTKYSHDGRFDWTAAKLRDWHADAGYDVVYVTDHKTFDGVDEALALDSAMVGQGTTLLPGLEAFYHGEHVNVLNAGLRYKGLTTADYANVDDEALGLSSMIGNSEPVLVETIPGNLSNIVPAHGPRTAGVRAIELIDGSPRGMSQGARDHNRIVHLADSLNLALVTGTDNHGWGKTAPGWTLMRVQDWRGYSPDSLSNRIEFVLRNSGRNATKVLERRTALASPIGVAFTGPVVLWTALRTISSGERFAWIVWIWVPWAIVWFVRRRRV